MQICICKHSSLEEIIQSRRDQTLFYEGSDRNSRFCMESYISYCYATVLLWNKTSHKQHVSPEVTSVSNSTVFIKKSEDEVLSRL